MTAPPPKLAAGIARARHLIEQLLDLSRATADGDPGRSLSAEPVALAELARDAVVRWEREAERRGIDLGAEIDAPVVTRGSPAQLDILLNNLVENALRYTPAGGVVDVVAGEFEGVPTLRVVDTGPGISSRTESGSSSASIAAPRRWPDWSRAAAWGWRSSSRSLIAMGRA